MNKDYFRIEGRAGEKTLSGELAIRPAKNAVLKAMASSILFNGKLMLEGVPYIEDVYRMRELLEYGGGVITEEKRMLTIDGEAFSKTEMHPDIAGKFRASIVLTGPMLARFNEVRFPHPGGCVIGARPIDIFLNNYEKLGVEVAHDGSHYHLRAPKGLIGTDLYLSVPSHTATESLMMAATLAQGVTRIHNAALEPEVADLAELLNKGGARISGAGSNVITIEGVEKLIAPEVPHQSIPDRIEAGSFLVLGALAAKELSITNCNPLHLGVPLAMLESAGVPFTVSEDAIHIQDNTSSNSEFKGMPIKTREYPGFPTDLQAPMTIFLTQSEGENIVFETIFDARLGYIQDLIRMGADILELDPHRILVRGPRKLKGRVLGSPDLRAGLAFIIAAIVAKGNSIIENVYFIDRGYEEIETRLKSLGLSIEREKGDAL